jgi:hypothetical protein
MTCARFSGLWLLPLVFCSGCSALSKYCDSRPIVCASVAIVAVTSLELSATKGLPTTAPHRPITTTQPIRCGSNCGT